MQGLSDIFASLPETVRYILGAITVLISGVCGSWLTIKLTKAKAAKADSEAAEHTVKSESMARNEEHKEERALAWKKLYEDLYEQLKREKDDSHREIQSLKEEVSKLRQEIHELNSAIGKERVQLSEVLKELQLFQKKYEGIREQLSQKDTIIQTMEQRFNEERLHHLAIRQKVDNNSFFIQSQEKAQKLPQVELSEQSQTLKLTGSSAPENSYAASFYGMLCSALGSYFTRHNNLQVTLFIPYCNTLSQKYLQDVLTFLYEKIQQGHEISFTWHYEQGDEDGKSLGEMFQSDFEGVNWKNLSTISHNQG